MVVLVIVVLAAVYGAFAYLQGVWPFQMREGVADEEAMMEEKDDQFAVWKTYVDPVGNFSFKYPPDWKFSTSEVPYLLLSSGNVSDEPCLDLGCPPRSGDRVDLSDGFTLEGAPPINPWFKALFVKGEVWVSIQMTDGSFECTTSEDCQSYLQRAAFTKGGQRVMDPDYDAYNQFVGVLDSFRFLDSFTEALEQDTRLYRNDQYSYDVRYPSGWEFEILGDGSVCFGDPNETYTIEESEVCGVLVSAYIPGAESLGIDELVRLRELQTPDWPAETVFIDGIEATKIWGEVYVMKNGIQYAISVPARTTREDPPFFVLFLSTFRFTR